MILTKIKQYLFDYDFKKKVWFSNRRAKWRREEKEIFKGRNTSSSSLSSSPNSLANGTLNQTGLNNDSNLHLPNGMCNKINGEQNKFFNQQQQQQHLQQHQTNQILQSNPAATSSSSSSSSSPPLINPKLNLNNKASISQKNVNILPTNLLNSKNTPTINTQPQIQQTATVTATSNATNTKESVGIKAQSSNNDSINGSSMSSSGSSSSSSSSSINGEVTAFNTEFGEEKVQSNEDLDDFIHKSGNVQSFVASSPRTQSNNDW
jgi:hypothetical protein